MTWHPGRKVSSKVLKQNALEAHPQIAPHIPHTKTYNDSNLIEMLNRYNMVFVKPIKGSLGNGVIQVSKIDGGYSYKVNSKKYKVTSYEALLRGLASSKMKRAYIIQQGIDLLRIDGSPVDYRVKYVLDKGMWRYRIILGRVARPGLSITNISKGGRVLHCNTAIRRTLGAGAVSHTIEEMKQLTRLCTYVLEQRFPGITHLGYDYGIDKNGKIWIFEVNTSPN
ncbi:YheC/YheD family protein [Paenibacillus endoradicis]|uniref:YheC/YheD family protein n=1 Tax=Paenibacillus endoradicis TaxID=2972487 RepID=UPI00215934BF|nr:YheC/YheD family protein [Paenibacillus endoradicis]MCR8659439.1 YheC/YheD family protein [Paenibacillus endoradicis]